MAIVKVYFRKSAAQQIRYAFRNALPGDPVDSESCPANEEGAIEEFRQQRLTHDFEAGRNEVVTVIQSWHPEESKRLTPEQANAMGKKLVEQYFKGHQFVVVTHTDRENLHNHIIVNRVNMESGHLIEKKYKHLHELRKVNDQICIEHGLSIPNRDATLRRENVPDRVRQMVRFEKPSWVWDIKTKADVSRFLATSYDEYVDYMGAQGIHVQVEDKNITYFYPRRSRGKRGDKLGKLYDKPGLEEQFKVNDERFRERPEFRAAIWARADALMRSQGDSLRDPSAVLLASGVDRSSLPKDYGAYTKTSRRSRNVEPASNRELRGIVPANALRQAADGSILEYCKRNNIGLATNAKGQTVLSGKEHIVIHPDNRAINTKNGTVANLIDFVSAHHRLTLLQAFAKISNNREVLLLEKEFGAVKRNYTSFYVPKSNQMGFEKATAHLSRFLHTHGANQKAADSLLKHQRAEVSKDGVISLFGDCDPGGALEFTEGPANVWTERKRGTFKRPFYKRAPRTDQLLVFVGPQSYISSFDAKTFSDSSHHHGILALMEPSVGQVESFLGEHEGIKRVQFVQPKGREFNQGELDFFGVLKKKLAHRGIEVDTISHEKARERERGGLSL